MVSDDFSDGLFGPEADDPGDAPEQQGTLTFADAPDEIDARSRIFCNRWGYTGARQSMLRELRALIRFARTGEEPSE